MQTVMYFLNTLTFNLKTFLSIDNGQDEKDVISDVICLVKSLNFYTNYAGDVVHFN